MIPFGKRAKQLPTVLSAEEVDSLLQCTPNLKHRTFLMTLYAAGLRLSEAANLKMTDIDSQRMQLNIQTGKGHKQRQVPLSPRLLEALRVYWKQYRPPRSCCSPARRPTNRYAGTSIQKTIKASAKTSQDRPRTSRPTRCATLTRPDCSKRASTSHDQPAAGPCEFHHDDGLPARPAEPLCCARPVRWTGCRPGNSRSGKILANLRRSPTITPRTTHRPKTDRRPDPRNTTPASYVAAYPNQAVPQVQSTLAKLSLCRTAAVGRSPVSLR